MPKSKKKQENQAFAKKKIKVGKVLEENGRPPMLPSRRERFPRSASWRGKRRGLRWLFFRIEFPKRGGDWVEAIVDGASGPDQNLSSPPIRGPSLTIDKTDVPRTMRTETLITKICTLPQDIMNPHFALLIAHTLRLLLALF
ncbi:unnamed protein product, partial [Mesorhabditis spiculigera]